MFCSLETTKEWTCMCPLPGPPRDRSPNLLLYLLVQPSIVESGSPDFKHHSLEPESDSTNQIVSPERLLPLLYDSETHRRVNVHDGRVGIRRLGPEDLLAHFCTEHFSRVSSPFTEHGPRQSGPETYSESDKPTLNILSSLIAKLMLL